MQSRPLILIVEDEIALAEVIQRELEYAGFQVQIFTKGSPAVQFAEKHFANIILLDVNLPDMTGFDILQQIRARGIEIPAIFLTAEAAPTDKLKGFDLGADDYISKPFNPQELIARINAVLRRTETSRDKLITPGVSITVEDFDFCGAVISPARMEMTFADGSKFAIGRKEIGIMTYLHQHRSRFVTRPSIIHAVWGKHADLKSRSIDQYMVRIRNLLKEHNCDLARFVSSRGGYTLDPSASAHKF